jgi:predicted GIY-YIG superfamily endonuclease
MTSDHTEVERLMAQHTKSELKTLLGDELGESFEEPVPGSLKNAFLGACYGRIAPEKDLRSHLQEHPDYSPDWLDKGQKHNLATAIRMVLTERVGRDPHDSITSLSKQVLAELVVAVRIADSNTTPASSADISPADAPNRERIATRRFDDVLSLSDTNDRAIDDWVATHRSPDDGAHAVYVLDCTPPLDGPENSRLQSLRASVAEKERDRGSWGELEAAGAAANQGDRIYYVGYATDVPSRIRQHLKGAAAASARFTNLFRARALVEVTWHDTETAAKQYEQRRARELTDPGQSFAYFN